LHNLRDSTKQEQLYHALLHILPAVLYQVLNNCYEHTGIYVL